MLDTTIHKTQDEDKQNKKHITICVRHHHTQDTRRRPTKLNTQRNICWTPPYTRHKTKTKKTKHNTICVGHYYAQDTRRTQSKHKTHHNRRWTPLYTRHKTNTNKTKNTTQYLLDNIIHKTQDEDKPKKKHNTICVGHHHTQDTRRKQQKKTQIKNQHNMCWTPLCANRHQ